MGKYYKRIVLLLCLLFASSAYAVSPAILHNMSSGSEPDQEYGATTTTWYYVSGWYDICVLQQAATTTGMTARYGYIYGNTGTGDNGFWVAVFENDGGAIGDQVGGCSDEGTITTDAAAWNQTTWSSDFPVLQPATEYFICYWTDAAAEIWYESAETGTSFYDGGTATCATEPLDASTFNELVTVSNYVAH